MAKDKGSKAQAQAPVTTVTIQDLVKETGLDARKIRSVIRAQGFKAPAIEQPEGSFGPRARYEWPSNSPDLAKIREAIKASQTKAAAKKSKDDDEEDDE